MKDTDFLYTIVILAAVAIVAVFVGLCDRNTAN